ncbi:tryptophan synthase subunit alpha [Sphingomonas adhaesiva]|uniref:tryptophan synthase subunit alpha n=1 Tax=Sphingomonas adhaesiva TaxID=28212 RepID=UPI002FF7DBDD
MTRIAGRFAARHAAGQTALIFYLAAGDPSPDATVASMHALVEGGADLIELGYPFCDPILDGPAIRRANRRALDAGGSLDATLEVVRRFRRDDGTTPVVLMGYANPIVSRGAAVVAALATAGVDGLIVPDWPLRETRALLPLLEAAGMVLVPLVPPGEVADAALLACAGVGGFAYCIAQAGPTGGGAPDAAAVAGLAARCRALVDLPVGVGFGIRTPDSAAALAPHADAVIVGSALVERIAGLSAEGASVADIATQVCAFAAGFRRAIDG